MDTARVKIVNPIEKRTELELTEEYRDENDEVIFPCDVTADPSTDLVVKW